MEKSPQSPYNSNYNEVPNNAPPGYAQATGANLQPVYPPAGGFTPQQPQHFHNPSPNTAPSPLYPIPTSVPIVPQQPTTVYVQSAPAQGIRLGPNPTTVTCPSCHQTRVSEVRYESSTKTHLFATILCLTTCCCCIPYMIDSCKNANHICTNCGAYLGTYNN